MIDESAEPQMANLHTILPTSFSCHSELQNAYRLLLVQKLAMQNGLYEDCHFRFRKALHSRIRPLANVRLPLNTRIRNMTHVFAIWHTYSLYDTRIRYITHVFAIWHTYSAYNRLGRNVSKLNTIEVNCISIAFRTEHLTCLAENKSSIGQTTMLLCPSY